MLGILGISLGTFASRSRQGGKAKGLLVITQAKLKRHAYGTDIKSVAEFSGSQGAEIAKMYCGLSV